MLKKLTTKNFRRLNDHTFNFGEGLVVLRGANESGKSTMLEAIGYALFGVKACRGPLAEIATWGSPESSVKVVLVLESEGVEYTISRSKSGAEINYPGGRVTGQNECSHFVGRLFGVESGTINKLMVGAQGDIRGALEEGPTATMTLIERLANFGILDRVIELIQSRLLTGSSGAHEDRVARQQAKVDDLQRSLVAPDTDTDTARINELLKVGLELRKEIDAVWGPNLDRASVQLQEAQATASSLSMAQKYLANAQNEERVRLDEISKAEAGAATPVDEGKLEALEQELKAAHSHEDSRKVYDSLKRLVYPEDSWEGDMDSLVVTIHTLQIRASKARTEWLTAEGEIKTLKAQKVTSSICGYCGQDFSQFPEIAKKNQELDDKIVDLSATVARLKLEEHTWNTSMKELSAIQQAAKPFFALAAADYIEADLGFVPPRLSWKGPVPTGQPRPVSAILNEKVQVQATLKAVEAARVRAETLRGMLPFTRAEIVRLQTEVDKLSPVVQQIPALEQAMKAAAKEHNERVARLESMRDEREELARKVREAKALYDSQVQLLTSAKAELAASQAELRQLEFNNALLKRVRAARPVIADRLWAVVLAAVSSYFSAVRGTPSLVNKDEDGFKVDGRPITGLSGSTLDALGLAIRLALVRTFLPTSPFLILDEPSAAMDDTRTESMLGFLSAAGFRQTLLATHDVLSETVASELIQL